MFRQTQTFAWLRTGLGVVAIIPPGGQLAGPRAPRRTALLTSKALDSVVTSTLTRGLLGNVTDERRG